LLILQRHSGEYGIREHLRQKALRFQLRIFVVKFHECKDKKSQLKPGGLLRSAAPRYPLQVRPRAKPTHFGLSTTIAGREIRLAKIRYIKLPIANQNEN
jgi:hypothetical protein